MTHPARSPPNPRQHKTFTAARKATVLVVLGALVGTVAVHIAVSATVERWQVETDQVGAKMNRWSRESRATTDTLLIGSSQIYRHVIPSLFEQEVRSYGRSVDAYNFGVPGMHCLELLFLVEWVLESKPDQLQRMVLHCQAGELELGGANWEAERTLRWHTGSVLARILHWYRRQPDWPSSWQAQWQHISLFLQRESNLGEGVKRIAAARANGQQHDLFYRQDALGTDKGFLALDRELSQSSGRTKADIERRVAMVDEAFMNRMVRWNRSAAPENLEPFRVELMVEIERLVRTAGVEPWWLVPPKPRSMPDLLYAHQQGWIKNLIRLDRPQDYPELFERRLRADRHHLTEEGARLLTKLAAKTMFEKPAQPVRREP